MARSQDALLEQGVVEAHDDAAGHLRLAGQLVDDQAAVLHGDHVLDPDDAGLGIDQHLGDLHAADLPAGDVRVVRLVGDRQAPLALALGLVHAEPGAELLPRPLLLVLRVHDLARLDRQVLRVGPDLRARPS